MRVFRACAASVEDTGDGVRVVLSDAGGPVAAVDVPHAVVAELGDALSRCARRRDGALLRAAANRVRRIVREPITGFPCQACKGSGEHVDSTEGGIWVLCDCPGNIAKDGPLRRAR